MRAADRRELILGSAMRVFGDHGYVGTTTAEIARAAGVSQPYVIRIFGTKEKLCLEVLNRALAELLAAFAAALDTDSKLPPGEPARPVAQRLGAAYVNLVANRGLLLSLMHAFVLGPDPVIGAVARAGFMAVYRFLRERAGFTAAQAQGFLAQGMLINTMIGLRMVDDLDNVHNTNNDYTAELLDGAFGGQIDVLLALKATERAGE